MALKFCKCSSFTFCLNGIHTICKIVDSLLSFLGLQNHGSFILPLPNPYISMDYFLKEFILTQLTYEKLHKYTAHVFYLKIF
jgi:hypothetical protein